MHPLGLLIVSAVSLAYLMFSTLYVAGPTPGSIAALCVGLVVSATMASKIHTQHIVIKRRKAGVEQLLCDLVARLGDKEATAGWLVHELTLYPEHLGIGNVPYRKVLEGLQKAFEANPDSQLYYRILDALEKLDAQECPLRYNEN